MASGQVLKVDDFLSKRNNFLSTANRQFRFGDFAVLATSFPYVFRHPAHLNCLFHFVTDSPGLRRYRSSSQVIDQAQDFPEQVSWHHNLCQLKSDIAAMTDHLGPNLHQLLPQCCQRPVLDPLWQGQ